MMGKDVIIDDSKVKYTLMKRMPLERMPHQDVIDYLEAKRVNRLPPRFPRWEEDTAVPSLQAVVSRRELHDAKSNLQDTRRVGAKAQESLQKQIDIVVKDEKDLGRSFIKFNRFVKENADKRERAIWKIEESQILNEGLADEIAGLQNTYDGYISIRASLAEMIQKYSIYEKYLDQSAELSPYLTSVQSVVKRYEALMSARLVISQRMNENMFELSKTIDHSNRMNSEKNAMINQMKYELRQKEKRHGAVKRFTDDWDAAIMKISNMAYQKVADIHCVRFSSWDLYQMMAARRHLPITLDGFDQEGHYVFIQESINLLKKCVDESEKLVEEGCDEPESMIISGIKTPRRDGDEVTSTSNS